MEDGAICASCNEGALVYDGHESMYVCEACGYVAQDRGCNFVNQVDRDMGEAGQVVDADDSGERAAAFSLQHSSGAPKSLTYSFFKRTRTTEDSLKKRLKRMGEAVQLSTHAREEATGILSCVIEKGLAKCGHPDLVAAACLCAAVRSLTVPLTVGEIAASISRKENELLKVFRNVAAGIGLSLPETSGRGFIERALAHLIPCKAEEERGAWQQLVREVSKHSYLLCDFAKWRNLHTGRRMLPLVAAAIQLAAATNEVKLSEDDVARACNVSSRTMHMRGVELREALVAVAKELPLYAHLTLPSLPARLPTIMLFVEKKMAALPRGPSSPLHANATSPSPATARDLAPAPVKGEDGVAELASLHHPPTHFPNLQTANQRVPGEPPGIPAPDSARAVEHSQQPGDRERGPAPAGEAPANNAGAQAGEHEFPPRVKRLRHHLGVVAGREDDWAPRGKRKWAREEQSTDLAANEMAPLGVDGYWRRRRVVPEVEARRHEANPSGMPPAFVAATIARARMQKRIAAAKARISLAEHAQQQHQQQQQDTCSQDPRHDGAHGPTPMLTWVDQKHDLAHGNAPTCTAEDWKPVGAHGAPPQGTWVKRQGACGGIDGLLGLMPCGGSVASTVDAEDRLVEWLLLKEVPEEAILEGSNNLGGLRARVRAEEGGGAAGEAGARIREDGTAEMSEEELSSYICTKSEVEMKKRLRPFD